MSRVMFVVLKCILNATIEWESQLHAIAGINQFAHIYINARFEINLVRTRSLNNSTGAADPRATNLHRTKRKMRAICVRVN